MGSESPPSSGNDAYCIAGREVPQDKSKAVQEMLLVTQWVSVFSLEGQIGILWKSQSEACSRHTLKRILGVSSQTQPRHANLLLPFLTVGKTSLLFFMKSIVLLCLLVCVHAGQVYGPHLFLLLTSCICAIRAMDAGLFCAV